MARNTARPPSQRQLRIGEEIRHALAGIFLRGDLHDPDLAGIPITVTEVRTGSDLKSATAYVMPLGGGEEPAVLAALRRAAPFLRGQLAREVSLKFTPSLRFEIDRSFGEAKRIDGLLRDIGADKPGQDGGDGA
ncbi:MAG: 30S ribosome-binding factor RbfA [Alphaproteobacteria bacterium]